MIVKFFEFVWNAKRFAIACLLLLVFLPAVSGTSKLLMGIPDFRNLASWRLRRWVQLFPSYPWKNWYKNWYLHFCKTYEHQNWQAGTSTGFDSNEDNEAGADDVITSRLRDKLKALYLHYHSAYGHQTGQDGNLP